MSKEFNIKDGYVSEEAKMQFKCFYRDPTEEEHKYIMASISDECMLSFTSYAALGIIAGVMIVEGIWRKVTLGAMIGALTYLLVRKHKNRVEMVKNKEYTVIRNGLSFKVLFNNGDLYELD